MDDPVRCSRDDRGVVTLTLNRAPVHNAFDDVLIGMLIEVLEGVDGACRVVVLRSEGKSFSAGADLQWMKRMAEASEEENLKDARALGNLLFRLSHLPVPTVARVQGAAFGGGVGLVCCCDIAIASEGAVFALSEVRLGLIPATISPYVISSLGPRAARRLFLTGARVGAEEALRIGLVHEVVGADLLDERVEAVIANLLEGGPRAQAEAKRLVRDVARAGIDDALVEETSRRIARIRCDDEGREGIAAFLERRKPRW